MLILKIRNYWASLPDFSMSHILLRIPLAIVFIQQGLSKFPVDGATGGAFGIPYLVWWFVCYGEVAAIAIGRKVAEGVHAMVVPGSGLVKHQAEMCGNGIRVMARYLTDRKHQKSGIYAINTRDGKKFNL